MERKTKLMVVFVADFNKQHHHNSWIRNADRTPYHPTQDPTASGTRHCHTVGDLVNCTIGWGLRPG